MTDHVPVPEPYASGLLDVGEGHHLYWETVGSPDGVPAVFLHGGPGSGCSAGARRTFDRKRFRGVLFDQRGCGRSRPLANEADADLSTNTTAHLVADIERLREHLGVERWVVVGVSWGVTLGLVYAERHAERVLGLVLGGVTAGTSRELEWITRDVGRLFPREWERFVSVLPAAERSGNLAAGYALLLQDPDAAVHEAAAREWCLWEDTHVSLMPGWEPDPRYQDPDFRLLFARLVTHYWGSGCFLAEGEVFEQLSGIADIPAVLIHGRYDVSGPLETAWRLHQAWPASRLVVLDDAGHGGGSFNAEMTAALSSMASEQSTR